MTLSRSPLPDFRSLSASHALPEYRGSTAAVEALHGFRRSNYMAAP